MSECVHVNGGRLCQLSQMQSDLTAERQRADAAEKERDEARREVAAWKEAAKIAGYMDDQGTVVRVDRYLSKRVAEILFAEESK